MKPNTETEDCLNCILRPLIYAGKLFGIYHVKSECRHGKNYFVQYKRSTISIAIGFILLISVAIIAIRDIRDLYLNTSSYSLQNNVFKFGLIVFQVNVFFTLLMQKLHANLNVEEHQLFFEIIHDKDLYGIQNFINKKDGRFFRIYVRLGLTYTFVVAIVVVGSEMMFLENYEFWTIYNSLTCCIYMILETIFFGIVLMKTKLYAFMIAKSYEKIQVVLNERLTRILNNKKTSIGNGSGVLLFPAEKMTRMDFPIHNMLQKLQRLHCRIIENFRRFNNCLNPLILSHFIAHILIFILNYYLLIVIWITGTSIHSIALKQIETNMILLLTVFITYETEKLYVPVNIFVVYYHGILIQCRI